MTAATILEKVIRNGAQPRYIRAINNRAPASLPPHKAGIGQHVEMGRECILRDAKHLRQRASGQPSRLVTHKQAQCLKTGALRQREKAKNDIIGFHISRLIEIR